jgi:hypothetical protein
LAQFVGAAAELEFTMQGKKVFAIVDIFPGQLPKKGQRKVGALGVGIVVFEVVNTRIINRLIAAILN